MTTPRIPDPATPIALLRVWDERDYGDLPYVLVELTPGFCTLALERIALVTQLKAAGKHSLYELAYWDTHPTWLTRPDTDALDEEAADAIEALFDDADDQETVFLDPGTFLCTITDYDDARLVSVECTRMLVTPEGITWETYLKHTSVTCTTAQLTRAELEKYAPPAPPAPVLRPAFVPDQPTPEPLPAGALTVDDYRESQGGCCPVCKSGDITGDSFECEAGTVWQDVCCQACGAKWQDVYFLQGYDYLKLSAKEA